MHPPGSHIPAPLHVSPATVHPGAHVPPQPSGPHSRPVQLGVHTHIPAPLHVSPATVHPGAHVPPQPSGPHSRPVQFGVHTHIPAPLHVSPATVHPGAHVLPQPSGPHSRPLQLGVHVQAWVLQGSVMGPTQFAPPLAGAGAVHERDRVPPPHGKLHAPNSVQPPSTGPQTCVLQAWLVAPSQSAPPLAGAGAVHVRVCWPVPHGAVQVLHSVQPPSTGASVHIRPSSPSGAGAGRSTQARPSAQAGAFAQASMSAQSVGVSSLQL
jgi:hypothetical protein